MRSCSDISRVSSRSANASGSANSTVPSATAEAPAATGTRLTSIGEVVVAAEGVRYTDASGREVAVTPGFEHFVTGRA